MSRQTFSAAFLLAALLAPSVTVAQALQPNDGATISPQGGTHAARRGLRGAAQPRSAQAPTAPPAAKKNPPPPVTPPAAAPLSPTPPGAPGVQVRGPEQEYQDCLNLWDKGTHMTRAEWATTCRRIQTRLTNIGKQTSELNQGRRRVR